MMNICMILFIIQKKDIVHMATLKFISIIMIIGLFCPSISLAYKTDVHMRITYEALEQNKVFFNELMNNIGFSGGVEQEIKGWEVKPIHEWLQYGSKWEDDIAFKAPWRITWLSERGVLYCHFYDPLFDVGYCNLLEDETQDEIGESLINRMNDYVLTGESGWSNHNEWSYQMARDLYYAALTGDSTKHEYWYMLDRAMRGPTYRQNRFEGKENMNHEEREQLFAWTFQALGHSLHLIQDASVPAHTRNDLHAAKYLSWIVPGDPEPFEEWTGDNYENDQLMNYNYYGSEPWDLWRNHEGIPAQNAFIDTFSHPEGSSTPDPISTSDTLDQGLAEYSYAHFLSEDSIGDDTLSSLDGLGFGHIGNVINKETKQIGDKIHSFFYVKNEVTGIDHYALCGISWSIKQMLGWQGHAPVNGILYSVNDFLVHQDYASKLIPRAVGYSAGFLDYFFRGQLEITAPNEFVYAIIDDSVTPQQFNKITAKVRNISPREKDEQGNTISYEPIEDGELLAVAKYKIRTDYAPDLSEDPPTKGEMQEVEFSYSVSDIVEISPPSQDCEANPDCHSLSSDKGEDIEFDFSSNPIPVGITDLYLQVIFKGTLGNEEDIGVAVGMKDLNEPDHYTIWNSTDMIDLFGVLRTPEEIYNNSTLFRLVDTNNNGALDDNECQIDSYNIKYSVAFFPKDDTSFNCYNATYDNLLPEKYGKFIVLTGEPEFNVYYETESDRLGIKPYLYNISGTVNQMNETDWVGTGVINSRGINSHFNFFIYHCCNATGDCSENYDFPNVEGDNLIPVQATNLVP